MPTYQYACTECGHAFEQFQSFSDDALTECPECQGRLRKLFNAVGVVFKGSGFYRNDSRDTTSSDAGLRRRESVVHVRSRGLREPTLREARRARRDVDSSDLVASSSAASTELRLALAEACGERRSRPARSRLPSRHARPRPR